MRHLLIITFTFLTISSFGQDKYNYVHFNKLTELVGTEYVIASMENRSKIETKNKYLLFINTQNGQTNQIDFPKDASIYKVEQIKIDSLEINKVLVIAKTVNLGDSRISFTEILEMNDVKYVVYDYAYDGDNESTTVAIVFKKDIIKVNVIKIHYNNDIKWYIIDDNN